MELFLVLVSFFSDNTFVRETYEKHPGLMD